MLTRQHRTTKFYDLTLLTLLCLLFNAYCIFLACKTDKKPTLQHLRGLVQGVIHSELKNLESAEQVSEVLLVIIVNLSELTRQRTVCYTAGLANINQ